jgi:hypothetical protein
MTHHEPDAAAFPSSARGVMAHTESSASHGEQSSSNAERTSFELTAPTAAAAAAPGRAAARAAARAASRARRATALSKSLPRCRFEPPGRPASSAPFRRAPAGACSGAGDSSRGLRPAAARRGRESGGAFPAAGVAHSSRGTTMQCSST